MEFLTTPITDIDTVNSFIDNLIAHDKLFHFDDDPFEIIGKGSEPVFTVEQATAVNARIAEICSLNLLEHAFTYALIKL